MIEEQQQQQTKNKCQKINKIKNRKPQLIAAAPGTHLLDTTVDVVENIKQKKNKILKKREKPFGLLYVESIEENREFTGAWERALGKCLSGWRASRKGATRRADEERPLKEDSVG